MKTRNVVFIITLALFMILIIAILVFKRNFIYYSVNGCHITINRDWPTYGLPLAELGAIRYYLSHNEMDKALVFLDQWISLVKTDAVERTKHCLPSDRLLILEALKQIDRQRGACIGSVDMEAEATLKTTNSDHNETAAP